MPTASTWAMGSSRKLRPSNLINGVVLIRRVKSVALILVAIGFLRIRTCVTDAQQNAPVSPPFSKIPNGPSRPLETVAMEEVEVRRQGEMEEEDLQELQNRRLTKSCGSYVKESNSNVNVKPTAKNRKNRTTQEETQSQ